MCAQPMKCPHPVWTVPREGHAPRIVHGAAGKEILGWSCCRNKVLWYHVVRLRGKDCQVWGVILNVSTKKRMPWFVSSRGCRTQLFSAFTYLDTCLPWARGSTWPVPTFFLRPADMGIGALETPKCHSFKICSLLSFENPAPIAFFFFFFLCFVFPFGCLPLVPLTCVHMSLLGSS